MATHHPISERSQDSSSVCDYGLDSVLECEEDFEVIQTTAVLGESSNARKLWGPELNPFGSNAIRETKSRSNEYHENAAWRKKISREGASIT